MIMPVFSSIIASCTALMIHSFFREINTGAMLIALVVFLVLVLSYTFRRSYKKGRLRPYWLDVLLPCGTVFVLSYVGYFFIPPSIFNYIFLPLRACEPFSLRSWFSIFVINIVLFILMTLTRFIAPKIQARRQKIKTYGKGKHKSEHRHKHSHRHKSHSYKRKSSHSHHSHKK